MNTRLWFTCGFLFVVGLAGCNKMPDKPGLYPVRGMVTYKGQPISQGSIEFQPDNLTIYPCSSAIKDGSFDMNTFAGTTKPDGAMPGKFRVAVTGQVGKGTDATKVPRRFGDVATSGLTVEVKSGGDRNLIIDVK